MQKFYFMYLSLRKIFVDVVFVLVLVLCGTLKKVSPQVYQEISSTLFFFSRLCGFAVYLETWPVWNLFCETTDPASFFPDGCLPPRASVGS